MSLAETNIRQIMSQNDKNLKRKVQHWLLPVNFTNNYPISNLMRISILPEAITIHIFKGSQTASCSTCFLNVNRAMPFLHA